MRTLTYWFCAILEDRPCYNIRARTKREAEAKRREEGADNYEAAVKVTVSFRDPFHLLTECLTEGGAYWEWDRKDNS